jgi:hypothetical protein
VRRPSPSSYFLQGLLHERLELLQLMASVEKELCAQRVLAGALARQELLQILALVPHVRHNLIQLVDEAVYLVNKIHASPLSRQCAHPCPPNGLSCDFSR